MSGALCVFFAMDGEMANLNLEDEEEDVFKEDPAKLFEIPIGGYLFD